MGNVDNIETSGKVRTSVYLTAENRQRLDDIPRGEKTAFINQALDDALDKLEKRSESYSDLMKRVKAFQGIKPSKPSEVLIRELRENRSRPNR